jgi:hypothetical protein
MSVASQDVYLNLTRPLSVIGTGGGGGSVNSVVGGANISTSGTTSVTVALQADLTSISSVDFTEGGAITGLSTINGAPVGVASLPADPSFSSITFDAGGAITGLSTINGAPVGVASLPADPSFSSITFNTGSSITNIFASTLNGDPSIFFQSGTSTLKGQFLVKSDGSQGGFTAMGYGPTSNAFQSAITLGENGIDLEAGAGNTVSFAADETVINSGLFSVPGVSGASISTLRADTYDGRTATISTLALSTIGAIVNSAASTIQTFNTVIGNMRIQGGSVVGATGGTTVNWATAFTTVPIVLATVEGTIGASVVATVQGAGENSANFSISAGGTGEIIDYIAIGGA